MFSFSMDDTCVRFPMGPVPLLSDIVLRSDSKQTVIWTLTVTGNGAWCIGVCPEESKTLRNFLPHQPALGIQTARLNGGSLKKLDLHEKVLKVEVSSIKKTAKFFVDGTLQHELSVADVFPCRLCLCGWNGTIATLMPGDSSKPTAAVTVKRSSTPLDAFLKLDGPFAATSSEDDTVAGGDEEEGGEGDDFGPSNTDEPAEGSSSSEIPVKDGNGISGRNIDECENLNASLGVVDTSRDFVALSTWESLMTVLLDAVEANTDELRSSMATDIIRTIAASDAYTKLLAPHFCRPLLIRCGLRAHLLVSTALQKIR